MIILIRCVGLLPPPQFSPPANQRAFYASELYYLGLLAILGRFCCCWKHSQLTPVPYCLAIGSLGIFTLHTWGNLCLLPPHFITLPSFCCPSLSPNSSSWIDLNSGLQTRTSLATGCPSLTKHEQHWTCPPSCTFPVVVGKWRHHLPPCSSQSYFHLFFHHLFTHIQSPPLLPNTFQIIFQDSTQSHPLQEFFTGHLPQASILV